MGYEAGIVYSPRNSVEDYVEAAKRNKGVVGDVAIDLGVTPQGVRYMIKKHAVIRDAFLECREAAVDRAETKLMELVEAGNVAAVIFTLKTLGKSRGYVEHRYNIYFAGVTPERVREMSDQELEALERELEKGGNPEGRG